MSSHGAQFSTNSAHVSVLQPLVHLSVWGYKGSRRMGGGGCTARKAGGVGVGGLEGLRGSLHRAQSCLCGGTRTVIKDSTAASTWFACLIICHMLNITAISHIRAPPLQQASLRLHESVGGWGQTPCSFWRRFTILLHLKWYCCLKAQATAESTTITLRIFFGFFAWYQKTKFHLHMWKLNKIQNGIIFWNSSSAFGLNPRFVWLFTKKKKKNILKTSMWLS